jgi:Amidase
MLAMLERTRLIDTADIVTGMGPALFDGYRPPFDAASAQGLRESGAVIVGKTVTTEFASAHPRNILGTSGVYARYPQPIACYRLGAPTLSNMRLRTPPASQDAEVFASGPKRLSVQRILDPGRHRNQAGIALFASAVHNCPRCCGKRVPLAETAAHAEGAPDRRRGRTGRSDGECIYCGSDGGVDGLRSKQA